MVVGLRQSAALSQLTFKASQLVSYVLYHRTLEFTLGR